MVTRGRRTTQDVMHNLEDFTFVGSAIDRIRNLLDDAVVDNSGYGYYLLFPSLVLFGVNMGYALLHVSEGVQYSTSPP